jgi:hypothetical protein
LKRVNTASNKNNLPLLLKGFLVWVYCINCIARGLYYFKNQHFFKKQTGLLKPYIRRPVAFHPMFNNHSFLSFSHFFTLAR